MTDQTQTFIAVPVFACVATLCLLFCMLILRPAAKRSERLAVGAFTHPRHLHPPPSSPTIARPDGPMRATSDKDTMLRRALDEHELKQGRVGHSDAGTSLAPPLSSQRSQSSLKQTLNPGYKNPLKPSSASVLNSRTEGGPPAIGSKGPIKRTASGLAKVLGGSFEDKAGSQEQPITIADESPVKMKITVSQAAQSDMFDENDFDSDIDLDVENPKPLTSKTTYPKLPTQHSQSAHISPVVYPSLPRQQQMQTGITQSLDLSEAAPYQSLGAGNMKSMPGSSNPLPWSSSPVEHQSPILGSRQAQRPGFGATKTGQGPLESRANLAPPVRTGRRTLPWSTDDVEESREQQPSYPTKPHDSKASNAATSTPFSKPQDQAKFLWNTSASAVKEQQKKHREEFKKASKKVEGTDDEVASAVVKRKRTAKIFLSDEQQHVLNLVAEQKKSVFFTGSAGTGKSVLMREIISTLRQKYSREPDRVAVTASTGLAACNVGGVTLHSFAGIGLGKEDVTELVKKVKKNQKAKHRWLRTKVLVVDEVSMVDGDLFDKLESIARQIRNNARPFGGIQLVITGDFFQLPPVPEQNRLAKFAFDAATWRTSVEHTIGLHKVFRQSDPVFAGMLNEMREGRLTESSVTAFRQLSRPLKFEDMLDATELFPTRVEVERANSDRLGLLQGKTYTFDARDGGTEQDKVRRDKLLQNCLAPESITLKKGAQVMLIKNIDETLVNGSLGRVIGFFDEREFTLYNRNDAAFPQSPGGTLQSSAAAGPDGAPDGAAAVSAPGGGGITTARRVPLVRFAVADGTFRELLCEPESWKIELPNGEVQASRSQIPLILAWALSIHKAQGQTLERVKVDLGKVFEKGQAYVALSRATTMAGLQVLRFDPKKVLAHERVRTFYANLSRVESGDTR